MAKPAGPDCNLRCGYCFYIGKGELLPRPEGPRMPDAVLGAYIRQVAELSRGPVVPYAWQGGEPTLAGLDFFRRAVDLQERWKPEGATVENGFQTNGTLIDDGWAAFLADNGFLVGLSLDGPPALHDANRVDLGGRPTSGAVMRALGAMRKRKVEFNTLTTVGSGNARRPREVYRFLHEAGSRHMQFIPLVERMGPDGRLAGPPVPGEAAPLAPFAVRPEEWGEFLCGIFDEWVARDVGRVFVQFFEQAVAVRCGLEPSLCHFVRECGRQFVLERDGDVYACDHFVYPGYLLGNILRTPLASIVESPVARELGKLKSVLPPECSSCEWLAACNGGCPKHRFARAPSGGAMNHLCEGYRAFHRHAAPKLDAIAALVRAGRPAEEVMDRSARRVGRNDPCPCGSGKKYKACCGRE